MGIGLEREKLNRDTGKQSSRSFLLLIHNPECRKEIKYLNSVLEGWEGQDVVKVLWEAPWQGTTSAALPSTPLGPQQFLSVLWHRKAFFLAFSLGFIPLSAVTCGKNWVPFPLCHSLVSHLTPSSLSARLYLSLAHILASPHCHFFSTSLEIPALGFCLFGCAGSVWGWVLFLSTGLAVVCLAGFWPGCPVCASHWRMEFWGDPVPSCRLCAHGAGISVCLHFPGDGIPRFGLVAPSSLEKHGDSPPPVFCWHFNAVFYIPAPQGWLNSVCASSLLPGIPPQPFPAIPSLVNSLSPFFP